MYTVYKLVDQRGDAVRYIGITDDVYSRFSQHLRCDGNNIDKNMWVSDLKAHDIMLLMITIETVDTVEEAREREQHWIHHYLSKGARLLNIDIAHSFTFEDFQAFFGERQPEKLQVRIPFINIDITTRRKPLTTAQAAYALGVTDRTIREWKRSGLLKVRVDGKLTAASVREVWKSRQERAS